MTAEKNINKDTAKAIDAATTLIKYCARYKDCSKCVFYSFGCAINRPYCYVEIKEVNK